MSFENEITEPCIFKLGSTDVNGEPVCPVPPPTPPTDPNCNDPAYRLAHPEECDGVQILILKPGSLTTCPLLGTQFKTFVYANGVEMEVSAGVEYGSSDGAVIQISAVSGKASAVDGGIATISASWQGLTAFSQVTVTDSEVCCEDTKVGMLVLLDNSKSMKRFFANPYGSRSFYVRQLIRHFFNTINEQKDAGALMSFTENGQLEQAFTNDLELLKDKITNLPTTNGNTNIAESLRDAIDYINLDATLTHKVIVLVTDGDNGPGDNPRVVADQFISSGGILVNVGVRAYGDGFDDLQHMASGGYFINTIEANMTQAFQMLSGLKGYFCAGNCVPPGGIEVPSPYLNYEGFINWDVTGVVDLIGGFPPYDAFDFLSNNGLYLDMMGSSAPFYGKITTKEEIDFVAGTLYRLTFKLAGNQRGDAPQSIQIKIGDDILSEDIAIADFKQPFTIYELDFTPDANESALLSFEQITGLTDKVAVYGILLDDIKLIRDPDGANEIIFEDNFDTENPTYIEPPCPIADGGYGYGYDCYGEGCLESPVGVQVPDPSPLTDDLEP